ncbi:ABC transporter ATP-binding protein [Agromyces aerolatus]|uniref:ABC transporter ATP-binding protein n=1 Tax=Agromyces sp. LY-1074 TaxID=3074080 RepID=UPI002862A001|nr:MULTISPECIES: ABC transporter ATP-binding protein [unclassified Agromyces]MDR5701910.1 ABC transporter ATP-binding protein [Agromyces sp. LY-1074]MDR5708122.1 ABC transporter ATP-binding protein [Agromyces sp. LY-1358]
MTDTTQPAVRLDQVSRLFGSDYAVQDVSLDVAQGELICLLGASGSGKTTLLRMIAGFDSPTSGRIMLGDRDVSRLAPSRREIGMVFQNYALFPTLTVEKNVEYGLRMRGWSSRDRSRRVAEMLERMHLSAFAKRRPSQLSGGQQQRVAIARALAYSPKLMLMDEPLGALDKALKQDMLREIREVHREFGTTILYVTHDREEALTLADRVAIMRNSKLVTCTPVTDLFLAPPTAYAAEFFTGANLIPVDRLPGATERDGADLVASVRPRDVALGAAQRGWTLQGTVSDSIFLGDDASLTVDLNGLTVVAQVPLAAAAAKPVGSPVSIAVERSSIHVLEDDRK